MEAAHYPGFYLDLHVVRCRIENSLKGGPAGPELAFFYFADGKYRDSRLNPLYKRQYQAEPGSRYLFFLTKDRGVLRSIGDVGDKYSIHVLTGAHPGGPISGADLGSRISEILLTPGDGADLGGMAGSLSRYSSVADYWGSRPHTVQMLRRLLSHPEPLRGAACGALLNNYHGQYDCLKEIAAGGGKSPEARRWIEDEMKRQAAERQLILDDLKDPARLAFADWAGDSRRRVLEELETFLFAPDAILHDRACTALKRYYPWESEPRCSGLKEYSPRQKAPPAGAAGS